MKTIRKYLKHVYFQDVYYGAAGGFIGALLAAIIGTATFYQVGLFTLAGMIISAVMIAKKRMSTQEH